MWKQLYARNTWLFVSPQKRRVAVICEGERKEIKLNNTGIMSISQNCIISTKTTILTPKKLDTATIIANYFKPVAADLTGSGTQSTPPEAHEAIMKPFEDINPIIKGEQDLRDDLDGIPWKSVTHHSMKTSIITTVCVVTLIIVLLYGSKVAVHLVKRRIPKNKARKPPSNQTEGIELEPLRSSRRQQETPTYAKVNIRPDCSGRQNVQVSQPEQKSKFLN
ncbi:hypothetical protein ABEB36_015066 [Hypothenemus hampei]